MIVHGRNLRCAGQTKNVPHQHKQLGLFYVEKGRSSFGQRSSTGSREPKPLRIDVSAPDVWNATLRLFFRPNQSIDSILGPPLLLGHLLVLYRSLNS